MGQTDSKTIAQVIKAQHENLRNAPELVWDDEKQIFITVPAGEAKKTGLPPATETATDVFGAYKF